MIENIHESKLWPSLPVFLRGVGGPWVPWCDADPGPPLVIQY